LTDESGATAIEYGLIAAGIAVVIIGAVQSVGTALNKTFHFGRNCNLNSPRSGSIMAGFVPAFF